MKYLSLKGMLLETSKVGPKRVVNFQPQNLNNAKNLQKLKTLPEKKLHSSESLP
jgi:hypothetical protein